MRYPAPFHSYVLADLGSGDSRVCRMLVPLYCCTWSHTHSHKITLSATSHHGGSDRPPTYSLHICIPRAFVRVQKRFIHSVVCLMTGPKPLPKRALHIVWSRASSFLLSLRSSSSFLRLLARPPVTSIPSFIFPSITRCGRQFLRKMWPIQFTFHFRVSCRIFLYSLTLSNTSSFLTWSVRNDIGQF